MNAQQLQARTSENVTHALGQATVKVIEAQTAAEMLAGENQELHARGVALQGFADQMTAVFAARALGAL